MSMEEFFDVEKVEDDELVLTPIIHHKSIKENTLDDYHSTRSSMKEMIEKGTGMIDSLIKVTKESESPRSYEVLSGYMKTIMEMNKALLEIHKDTKEITEEKDNQPVNNNYVYVGSTEELQKELEK